MLRVLKIVLVLSVAVWAFVGALGNLSDWAGTTGAVTAATSMATFEAAPTSWRATTNGAVILGGALFIVILKLTSGALCLEGARRMWLARGASAEVFFNAKTYALSGCAVAMFMLFFGWVVIAETWFELWRSEAMLEPVLGSAFRYFGMVGIIAIFLSLPEEQSTG